MSLLGLTIEEAVMHGWEFATQRAISRMELGLPLDYSAPGDLLSAAQVAGGETLDSRAGLTGRPCGYHEKFVPLCMECYPD